MTLTNRSRKLYTFRAVIDRWQNIKIIKRHFLRSLVLAMHDVGETIISQRHTHTHTHTYIHTHRKLVMAMAPGEIAYLSIYKCKREVFVTF